MQEQRPPPLPPLTAEMALACYKCFKDEDVLLSRCSQCLRIAYCSRGASSGICCTKAHYYLDRMPNEFYDTIYKLDWKMHKPMCKALSEIEKNRDTFVSLPSEPTKDLTFLNNITQEHHWDAARILHHAPCEEAYDGISQCEMNMQVCEDIKFQNFWTGYVEEKNISLKYVWCPPRVKASWTALTGASWENEFRDEMCQSLGVSVWIPVGSSMLRAASEHLTMAMTILYGLEKLNDDDSWTRKDTLAVHLVLCGPDAPGNRSAFDYGTCTGCTQRGCKRIQEHAVDTYHAYVQKKGSIFVRPDLCIAMNSGASQISRRTLPETFRTLVKRRISTLFTSFNREEADTEAALLRTAGATLHAALGPGKNSWGSLQVTPSHHKVMGFPRRADGLREVSDREPPNTHNVNTEFSGTRVRRLDVLVPLNKKKITHMGGLAWEEGGEDMKRQWNTVGGQGMGREAAMGG
ncbi:hypothetical protein C8J57DRAFT_1673330 [Mycena rebaudengoi]|nr:hypothetical protein C8J57DRAFT_1673330 [Mycena rebaudengoi]